MRRRGFFPNLKRYRDTFFFKGFTLKDFLLILGFGAIAVVIFVTTGALVGWARVVIAVLFFLFSSVMLVPINGDGKKLWKAIVEAIAFLLSPREFKYQSKKRDSRQFVDYREIDEDGIIEIKYSKKGK